MKRKYSEDYPAGKRSRADMFASIMEFDITNFKNFCSIFKRYRDAIKEKPIFLPKNGLILHATESGKPYFEFVDRELLLERSIDEYTEGEIKRAEELRRPFITVTIAGVERVINRRGHVDITDSMLELLRDQKSFTSLEEFKLKLTSYYQTYCDVRYGISLDFTSENADSEEYVYAPIQRIIDKVEGKVEDSWRSKLKFTSEASAAAGAGRGQ